MRLISEMPSRVVRRDGMFTEGRGGGWGGRTGEAGEKGDGQSHYVLQKR